VVRSELLALALGRGVHLGALTAVLARRYGDRPAVIDPTLVPGLGDDPTWTYERIEDAVGRLASVHRARGVAAGTRAMIVVDNRLDVALHTLALARLGAIPVPVNHRLTAGELDVIAKATDATAAVADVEVTEALPDRLAAVGVDAVADGFATAAHLPPGDLPVDDTAILLTTSGTTGAPKAAALTSHGLLSSLGRLTAVPLGADLGSLRRDRDRMLACLPLTHVMGLSVLLGALAAGVPLVRRSRFDAAEVLDLIESDRPNLVVAVPTMYADLERAGAAERDLSSVQAFVSSADVLTVDRARRRQS
jgi:fatty-acyl-CoA synthase